LNLFTGLQASNKNPFLFSFIFKNLNHLFMRQKIRYAAFACMLFFAFTSCQKKQDILNNEEVKHIYFQETLSPNEDFTLDLNALGEVDYYAMMMTRQATCNGSTSEIIANANPTIPYTYFYKPSTNHFGIDNQPVYDEVEITIIKNGNSGKLAGETSMSNASGYTSANGATNYNSTGPHRVIELQNSKDKSGRGTGPHKAIIHIHFTIK
jgi:hypothetical protein